MRVQIELVHGSAAGPLEIPEPGHAIGGYRLSRVLSRIETDTLPGAFLRSHAWANLIAMGKSVVTDAALLDCSNLSLLRKQAAAADQPWDVFEADENVVIAPIPSAVAYKRVSLLTRLPDVTRADFSLEWNGLHANLVKSLPGCRGYVQNLIRCRRGAPTHEAGELPFDGIAELYFDSKAAMDEAYSSNARAALRAHARTFISDIVTFAVHETWT